MTEEVDTRTCAFCDARVTDEPREELHEPREAKEGEERVAHEVCLLKSKLAEMAVTNSKLSRRYNVANQFLCAIVTKLGREVRFHRADIEVAIQLGLKLEARDEPGGFITLRMKNAVIVASAPVTTLKE